MVFPDAVIGTSFRMCHFSSAGTSSNARTPSWFASWAATSLAQSSSGGGGSLGSPMPREPVNNSPLPVTAVAMAALPHPFTHQRISPFARS